jgi:DNA polymerase-3 subunit delta'
MALRPVRPGPRIAILRDAQTLTPEAQSAMLKLLEEPPGFAVLILVTDNAAALFPTIRSRCQLIRFGLLDQKEIRRVLEAEGRDPLLATRAAVSSGGRADRALALTPESIADRDAVIEAYEDVRAGERADIDELILDLAARRKEGRPGLDALLEWQMRKVQARLGAVVTTENDALAARLDALAGEDPAALLEEASRTAWAMRALERNGNARLVLRELLLDVRDR